MGCQSLDEFVRTNVFYCHTTGHLQQKSHTGNSRFEIEELDGLLRPVKAVYFSTRGSRKEILSAILPCWKRRERMRGGPRAIRAAWLIPVSRGLYRYCAENWNHGKAEDFGTGNRWEMFSILFEVLSTLLAKLLVLNKIMLISLSFVS